MSDFLSYQPSRSAVYYTSPKNVNLFHLILGSLAATVLAVVGAALYGILLPEIGSLYLRGAFVLMLGIGVGTVGFIAMQYGKVRVLYIGAIIGAFLGLLAMYVMWLAWVVKTMRRLGFAATYGKLILHPIAFYRVIVTLNEFGTWQMDGQTSHGFPLLILWVGEAGILMTGAMLLTMKGVSNDEIACNACGQKCVSIGRFPKFDAAAADAITIAIENRDFEALLSQPPSRHEDAPEVGLSVNACPKCRQTNVLTLSRISWTVKNNRAQVVIDPLVKQLLITADETETLRQLRQQIEDARK